jgi:hypothetical protein
LEKTTKELTTPAVARDVNPAIVDRDAHGAPGRTDTVRYLGSPVEDDSDAMHTGVL